MRSCNLHRIFKLALVERLSLANGVHSGPWERSGKVAGLKKESWKEKGSTRSICGTVKSPIVYSTPKPPLVHPPRDVVGCKSVAHETLSILIAEEAPGSCGPGQAVI